MDKRSNATPISPTHTVKGGKLCATERAPRRILLMAGSARIEWTYNTISSTSKRTICCIVFKRRISLSTVIDSIDATNVMRQRSPTNHKHTRQASNSNGTAPYKQNHCLAALSFSVGLKSDRLSFQRIPSQQKLIGS